VTVRPEGAPGAFEPGSPWHAVDSILAGASLDGILAHKLGPLAAHRLRRLGEPVPPELEAEEQLVRAARLTAIPLLGRIREIADGPLLLLKGPEVACLYPGGARSFADVDLLTPDGIDVQESLKAAGFVEVDDPELFLDHHHLRPLQAPGLWLKVEIHLRPMLPRGAASPPVEQLVEAAVPSAVGVEGILAPQPVDHALILAGHGWVHEPLHTLRDLIDVAAVAQYADSAELARAARAWGMERVWRTTTGATRAVFGGGQRTAALRLFGGHLPHARERTVLDNHLQRWLHSFWELPFGRALLATGSALRQELLPAPGESWRGKFVRVRNAVLHPRRPMSAHTASWRGDVEGGRGRRQ
jgi:Uncharacterised nucleotidyltransferase